MYIDDCYVQSETFDMCLENINDTVNILENIGFVINREKFMMVPEKTVTFLGLLSVQKRLQLRYQKRS